VIRYLEDRAPCVYMPTFDWRHACVLPRLSSRVYAVGWSWEGDALCREQIHRLADYWSAVVAFTPAAARHVRIAEPLLAGRVVTIPDGLRVLSAPLARARGAGIPVQALIVGAALDSMEIDAGGLSERLRHSGVDVRLTMVGCGSPERMTDAALNRGSAARYLFPNELSDLMLGELDLVVAPVTERGLAAEAWEAIGHGAAPLLIGENGACPDPLTPGKTCWPVPTGDLDSLVTGLAVLSADAARREAVGRAALDAVRAILFRAEHMLDEYVSLFEQVLTARTVAATSPLAPMLAPPARVDGLEVFPVSLEHEVAGIGGFPSEADYTEYARRIDKALSSAAIA
jgi:hypothetical protein